jgi:hypothetical protein
MRKQISIRFLDGRLALVTIAGFIKGRSNLFIKNDYEKLVFTAPPSAKKMQISSVERHYRICLTRYFASGNVNAQKMHPGNPISRLSTERLQQSLQT